MSCALSDIPRHKGAAGDSLTIIWKGKGNAESTGLGGSKVGWKHQQTSTKSM